MSRERQPRRRQAQIRYDDLPDMLRVDEVQRYLRIGRHQAYDLARERGIYVGRPTTQLRGRPAD